MARRRLEHALLAGQNIAQGKMNEERFTKMTVDHVINLEMEAGGIYSIQYSFDGTFLAVGCGNGTIKLYEPKSGRKLADIRKTRYGGFPIMVLRFNPKNPCHIYGGTSEGQVLDCDISDFVPEDGKDIDFSQIPNDKEERWKEIITEKKGLDKNEINCMDFDYTYSCFATAGKDLDIRIYDVKTNQIVQEYPGYSVEDDDPTSPYSGCGQRVFSLRYHTEYDYIFVTGGWDRQLKIWDSRTKQGVMRTIHGPHICGDSLDIKGFKILTGSYVGKDALQIWDYSTDYGTSTKNKAKTVDFPSDAKGAFLYAAEFCDNDVVVAGGSGTNSAMAINSETNEVIGEVKFDHPVQAIDTVHGGRMFAVGDGKRCLKLCSLH